MAFSRNIFQAYTGMFVLENIQKAQNARAAAAP